MLRDVQVRRGHGVGDLRATTVTAGVTHRSNRGGILALQSARRPPPDAGDPSTVPAPAAPTSPRSSRAATARPRAAGSPRRSSPASCATGSRRASTAATSSRPTPPAGSCASSATRTGSSPCARRSSRSAPLALIEAGGIEAFDLEPAELADPGQLAFGRGPPRPDAPGDLPPVGRQPGAARLRLRGRPARRADRRPPGARRREGRPGPPHVLRASTPSRSCCRGSSGWDPTDYWKPSHPSQVAYRDGGRPGVRHDAGQAADRDRRLRRRDVRVPRCARSRAPTRCWPIPAAIPAGRSARRAGRRR